MHRLKYFIIVFIAFIFEPSCSKDEDVPEDTHRGIMINGVSFVGSRNEVGIEAFLPLETIHSNWVSLIPYGFIRRDSARVNFDTEWQWWGEKTAGILQNAKDARRINQRIMLKPQVWIWRGEFTGDYAPETEAGWEQIEQTYSAYILHFAEIATEIDADMYCIGTELKNFILRRPAFWDELISDVKKVYQGKLTYAANWDSYHLIPFWDKMDYIGVNAYFPLSGDKTPEVSSLKSAWEHYKSELEQWANQYQSTILFTEYGYASRDYTADKPWESWRDKPVNLQAQVNAYQAIFEAFWEAPWFGGGFFWKWFDYHEEAGGLEHAGYTPQNKPVQDVIEAHFLEQTKQ